MKSNSSKDRAPERTVRRCVQWLLGLSVFCLMMAGCSNDPTGPSNSTEEADTGSEDVGVDGGDTGDSRCIVDQECDGELICQEGDCVSPRDEEHESMKTYRDISAGHTHGCGITENLSVRCWGGSDMYRGELRTIPDDPRYIDVSASAGFDCALNGTGRARCWGLTNFHGRTEPPEEVLHLTELDAGEHHACAVHESGDMHCWGLGSEPPSEGEEGFNDFDQALPPDGENFVDVAVGYTHSCGLKDDGTLECWGQGNDPNEDEEGNDYDQAVAPDGEYTDVCAGRYRNCAIRESDGSIYCWGWTSFNKAREYPEGSFVQIACGRRHHCGVRRDGTIACWGRDRDGETEPPEGQFEQVTAGWFFSCARDSDGNVECWGSNNHNKLEVP